MDKKKSPSKDGNSPKKYSRRDALKAMAKYSAVVGGSAAVVVSAGGLVNEASAYGPTLPKKHKGGSVADRGGILR